jgi:hypothetical protein
LVLEMSVSAMCVTLCRKAVKVASFGAAVD